MKTAVFLTVPLLVQSIPLSGGWLGAEKQLKPRQFEGIAAGLVDWLLEDVKPHKVVEQKPNGKRVGAKRVKVYYGPFTVLPFNATKPYSMTRVDPNGFAWNGIAGGLPVDSTILIANTTLEYDDGRLAQLSNGMYNHHVMFLDTSRSSSNPITCEGDSSPAQTMPMSTLMGTAEDYGATWFSSPDGTFNSGYYLGKKNKVMMTGEVVNYTNETKIIYSVSDIEYVPGKPEGSLDTSIQIISVNQCEGMNPSLQQPPGQKVFTYTSQNVTIVHDGYILARRGHLHDGGENVQMKLNGKIICNSTAIYTKDARHLKDEDGKSWETISYMEDCAEPVKVRKGDSVVIEANYDLGKHPVGKHAAGAMGGGEDMGLMSFSFANT